MKPKSKDIIEISVPKETNMFVVEKKFRSVVVKDYRKHLISIDGDA